MILLFVFPLLFLQTDGGFLNSPRSHLSNVLKLKCDALPYRTAFVGTRCYFAVKRKVEYNSTASLCSAMFRGAKVATDANAAIFTAMMLDESDFHSGTDSSAAKQTLCTYDSGYECDGDSQPSAVMPGKCVHISTEKMKWMQNSLQAPKAEPYCSRLGMEVVSIRNDLENKMIMAFVNGPTWIRFTLYSKWTREGDFGRFGTCQSNDKYIRAASQIIPIMCSYWLMGTFIDKTGYWTLDGQYEGVYNVACVKNAQNDFNKERKSCAVPHHEWDEETGRCEWTGQKDACLQLIAFDNRTMFVQLPNFPKETYGELRIPNDLNDAISKVVVRRGCMYTGYSIDSPWDAFLGEDKRYGIHDVPSYYTGTLGSVGEGLTTAACYCDPTEATLNNHVPAPPPKKKCVEHHVFNEATQSCEWNEDPKYCGVLITHDGRRQKLEVPNWPMNRKYFALHWHDAKKRDENFHVTVTDIIVRQHCWATLSNMNAAGAKNNIKRTLETSGYGKHQVASYYNGLVTAIDQGTHKVVCECLK